ncbi:unnamed protein product [Rodentolepis nana]|uniref:Fibronectin type-III domain-containing protein n=1 Tax=Rodentolepis nana TaxID=102285 RepID=A0A3P7VAV5_RODNA|nr:unnamed protein product [Rodentolepis nana]
MTSGITEWKEQQRGKKSRGGGEGQKSTDTKVEKSVEADSAQLMWTKPRVPEGEELLDYSLWYSISNGTSANPKEDLLVIKAEETQVMLRGLTPDSNYHVRLAGRSSSGHGTTALLDFRTKEHRKSKRLNDWIYSAKVDGRMRKSDTVRVHEGSCFRPLSASPINSFTTGSTVSFFTVILCSQKEE